HPPLFPFPHDQIVLAFEFDLGTCVFADEDLLAGLDVEREDVAFVVHASVADGDDLGGLRFFFGGIGDDDPADALLRLLDALDEDAIAQWTHLHCEPPADGLWTPFPL